MMEQFQKQAERFGTEILFEDAISVDLRLTTLSRLRPTIRSSAADAMVIATGASAKWLGIDSEERLVNNGVSACATCDGALFRDKEMAVVGRWRYRPRRGPLPHALCAQGHPDPSPG